MTSTLFHTHTSVKSHITTLVFIDSAVEDHQLLVAGILPTAKVIVLDQQQDGIVEITQFLRETKVDSLQIIAHGSPGSLQLGSSKLSLDNLHNYRQHLQQWQTSEILIYGCEVAATQTGKTFLEQLHLITKANIAAATGKIGNVPGGGNWELEVKIGKISSTIALNPEATKAYPRVLISFAPASTLTVGASPASVVVVDFNGDDNLDLATANLSDNSVTVLLSDGTGGFASTSTFSVGLNPASVTVGDFNGDSNLDLATANSADNTVTVLLGNGTGGFGSTFNFTVGASPNSVTVGDFNGDSNLDLATANYFEDSVTLLLGDGTGGFSSTSTLTVGVNPNSVTVGDFNGDGKVDLATANYSDNSVTVLLNDGTGGFASTSSFTVGVKPNSLTVGDFNDDGNLDLATANSSDNSVTVLLGNGTGGFGSTSTLTVGVNPYSVTVGDFNGDGNVDLATANFDDNSVTALLGNGTGGFASTSTFTVGTNPASVTVGDFNSDGKVDLVTANRADNSLTVLPNTARVSITAGSNPKEAGTDGNFTITLDSPAPLGGLVVSFNTNGTTASSSDYTLVAGTNITNLTDTTFTIAEGKTNATLTVNAIPDAIDPNESITLNIELGLNYILGAGSTANFDSVSTSPFIVGLNPASVVVGDFNGDGNLDLATANLSDNSVTVLLSDGTGGFGSTSTFTVGLNPASVTVGDFNSDGNLDLATANSADNTVTVLLGNGTGGFGSTSTLTVGLNPNSVTVGDFNSDGNLDLATANYFEDSVTLLLGDGTGGFGSTSTLTVGVNPNSVTVGDFNGDGNVDLATANYSDNSVTVLLNDGTGGFGSTSTLTVGVNPNSVTVGDFNGDGNLDLATANLSDNSVTVLLGNGTGGFGSTSTLTVGVNPYSVTVGDFNGDGNLDLATANFDDNSVTALLGNGTGSFASTSTFTVGANPASVTVGDFNSDDKVDLVTANRADNSLTVLLNTAIDASSTANFDSVSTSPFTVGISPASVVVVDFNGDGNLDLATANLSDNTVTVLLGNGTGGFGSTSTFSVGLNPASVTVGDFNSDGNLDLATANSADNTVTVLLGNGTGGFGSTSTLTVGLNPNSVTVGDFNSDGNLDLATANYFEDSVTLLLGDGTGGFGSTSTLTVGVNPNSVTVGDFNGDGNVDLATANYSDNSVTVLLNDGTGGFGSTSTLTVGVNPNSVTVGDFNGDGNLDLATANLSDNSVTVLLGNGTGGFGSTSTLTVGVNPYSVTVGDFNGDGNLDLATANFDDNSVTALLGNGTGGFASTSTFTVGTNPASVTVGDFNSDGKVDLLTANRADNSLTVLLNVTSATLVVEDNNAPTDLTLSATSINDNVDSETVVGTFTSTDPDKDNIFIYSLVAGSGATDNAEFTIDGNSLKINSSPDFETKSSYNILVRTTDNGELFYDKPLTITVNDVNEQPTDLELSQADVDENVGANTVIGTFTSTDPDKDNTFIYSLVTGSGATDNAAFTIDGNSLKINSSPDFETKSSYNILVRTTDNGELFYDKPLTISVNDVSEESTDIQSRLTNINDDIFNITSNSTKVKLKVNITGRSSQLANELGVFNVDDAAGTIDGIAPGQQGYTQAALQRSQVLFSAIANLPNGFNTNNLTRLLELDSGENFRFYLIKNSTTDAVKSGITPTTELLFSNTSTQKITKQDGDVFSLAWEDGFGNSVTDFKDLVVNIQSTNESLTLGTDLQAESQSELIDLRDATSLVKAEFVVNREAAFDNFVGFYQVTSNNGGIDTNGDGSADILPGQAGYTQAAVRGRVAGIDLAVNNQGTANYTGNFQPGSIFAPFIIVDGRASAILDNNSNNDPAVYFPFLGSNSDGVDHIRLLGDNAFGFEDLAKGGDKDYNDIIVRVNLTTT